MYVCMFVICFKTFVCVFLILSLVVVSPRLSGWLKRYLLVYLLLIVKH